MKKSKKLKYSTSGKLMNYVSHFQIIKSLLSESLQQLQNRGEKLKEILSKLRGDASIFRKKKEEEAKNKSLNELTSENSKRLKKIKKVRKVAKFEIEQGRPYCLLYRIRKINPEIKLNYQLELYQKKQRYSVSKQVEMVDENKHDRRFFERNNPENEYTYQPCLSQRGFKNHFFLQNKKSIGHGEFRSITSHFKSKKNNYNIYDFSAIFEEKDKDYIEDINASTFFLTNNKKVSTKVSTKTNSVETSRLFSTKYILNEARIRNSREKLKYLKLRGLELKNRVHDTFDKANNASMELNQDIVNSKNYDKLFGPKRNNDEKYFKRDYKKINENKNKLKNYLFKCVDVKKDKLNLLPRNFQYLDKEGKRILMEAGIRDRYKQIFLNKTESKKAFALNSKYYLNKLIGELNNLGSDILATKKKFKGEDAIEPKNEKLFFHGLIRENMLRNLSDKNYFEEVMRRKNVDESMDSKVEKRLFTLKQRSVAMRQKVRQGNCL